MNKKRKQNKTFKSPFLSGSDMKHVRTKRNKSSRKS